MPRKKQALKRAERPVFTWESQVRQYPATGPAGYSYFRGDMKDGSGRYVDCILYREPDGQLVGILNRYPFDFPPWEQAGNINVWVRPDRQRQGIGAGLVEVAMGRWDIDLEAQRYTESGRRLYRALKRQKGGA